MAEMQVLTESQEFGRGFPRITPQEFGKGFPQVVPFQFGGRIPQTLPQEFGGRIPFIDQGWRSPWREIPPSGSARLLH